MNLLRTFKVWRLKRRARAAYLRWLEFDSDLDCGAHMADMLRPARRLVADFAAQEFNRCLDQLREMGEEVPEGKLGSWK